jgi:hypothetical protein
VLIYVSVLHAHHVHVVMLYICACCTYVHVGCMFSRAERKTPLRNGGLFLRLRVIKLILSKVVRIGIHTLVKYFRS